MATIIIITPPPTRPKSAKIEDERREFERPDGESLADSLRAIADQVDGEG